MGRGPVGRADARGGGWAGDGRGLDLAGLGAGGDRRAQAAGQGGPLDLVGALPVEGREEALQHHGVVYSDLRDVLDDFVQREAGAIDPREPGLAARVELGPDLAAPAVLCGDTPSPIPISLCRPSYA